MDETTKTKGEQAIERIMEQLDPDSPRYQVLATAKRFKSSWVELGEKLLQVQKEGMFAQWGYGSFEDYCSREIHIRQPTAQKLTLAYRFLEREEPQLLARRVELKPLPDYRSVELLRQAREEQNFSEEEYARLRQVVVEDERSHATVQKHFREASHLRAGAPEAEASALREALTLAKRLQGKLASLAELPEVHLQASAALIDWLNGHGEGES